LTSLKIVCGTSDVDLPAITEHWPLVRLLEKLKAPKLKTLRLELDIDRSRYVAVPDGGSALFPLDRFPALHRLSAFFISWRKPDMLEDRIRACDSMSILIAAREKAVLYAYFLSDSMLSVSTNCTARYWKKKITELLSAQDDEATPSTYFDGRAYKHDPLYLRDGV
jgi:hypothetical protein